MKSLLEYSYTSSMLRIAPIFLSTGAKIDIVLAANKKNTIDVGFQLDTVMPNLGYKNAAKIMRNTVAAIQDVLATKNEMISAIKSDEIVIEMTIMSSAQSRRLRMYSNLIEKHIPAMEQSKEIPFHHSKTDIINGTIKIFIQRA